MELIKEPLGVDFYVTGQQMNEDDQKRVSEYIELQNAKKESARKVKAQSISTRPSSSVKEPLTKF